MSDDTRSETYAEPARPPLRRSTVPGTGTYVGELR